MHRLFCPRFLLLSLAAMAGLILSPFFLQAQDQHAQTNQVQQQTASHNLDKLIQNLKSSNRDVRADAAAQLAEHSDEFEKFAKPLAELLIVRDEVLTDTAKRIFRQLGHKAVVALQPDLTSKDVDHLRLVCSAINAVGQPCREYESALVNILENDNDMNRRVAAMFALTGFDNGSPNAIDHVLKDLKHQDMNVTLFAIRLIIKTGPEAKQAIPNLKALFEEGVISQRGYVNWALASIGQSEENDVVALTEKQLGRFNVVERERALISAGLLGPAAKDMEPKVRELMDLDYSNLEGQGAVTLWQITGDPKDPVERLIQITKDFTEYEVNGPKYLGQMGAAAAPAAEFLVEQLSSPDSSVQIQILDSLGSIGPTAAEHRDKIADFVKSSVSPLVKLVGKETLAKIDGTE